MIHFGIIWYYLGKMDTDGSFDTYLHFKDWLTPIESFFTSFQNFLSTVFHDASNQPIQNIMHDIDVICDDLAKSNESDFEDALHSLCEKDHIVYNIKFPLHQIYVWNRCFQTTRSDEKVVHTEKKHLKWDTEIVSPNINLIKLHLTFPLMMAIGNIHKIMKYQVLKIS